MSNKHIRCYNYYKINATKLIEKQSIPYVISCLSYKADYTIVLYLCCGVLYFDCCLFVCCL